MASQVGTSAFVDPAGIPVLSVSQVNTVASEARAAGFREALAKGGIVLAVLALAALVVWFVKRRV